MFIVGKPSVQGKRLCEVTYACLWAGIRQVRPGARLGDIGHAIQTLAEKTVIPLSASFAAMALVYTSMKNRKSCILASRELVWN